jgi:molybdopterin converting factor small subunit
MIKIHLLIRGRIGEGWVDFDEDLKLPPGTTLRGLVAIADARRIPMSEALAKSPHLAETLMLNGERTPIAEHGDRVLADGDQIYLLAPLAGG